MPPFGVDLVRLRQRDQVADRPGDHVAVAVQVSVALVFAPSTRAMSRATEGFSASTATVPDSGPFMLRYRAMTVREWPTSYPE